MIYIDDNDPIGTLEPSFPPRDVTIKRNADAKQLYELISEIGRGKFGTVYKCKEKSTKLELAAKFVPIPKREDRRNVEREVEIMNLLQHPLIIQLYAAYEYQKMMCVVLELIEGGELFDRVVDDDFILTERVCTIFIRQVCEAMQFIHRNNILHLDLKPENILCLTKKGNRIKIIDFGLARKYDPDKKLQILFGTPEFVAPEVVNFDYISFGTDMWSVGVICYVLLSGLSPFMGETDIETMANVTIAKYDFDDEAFSNISQEALDFISKLLVKDMNSRMTATECLEHKWLERRSKSVPSPMEQPQTILKSNDIVKVKEPSLLTEQLIIQPPPKYTTTPPTPPPVTPEQPPPPPSPKPILPPSSPMPQGATVTSTIIKAEENEIPSDLPKIPSIEAVSKSPPPPPPSKKKELLEQAKDNLKTFIERWEEHPNSPYVFDSGSYLIAPIHLDSSTNATKGSSNVSSRACSPSPCGSIIDEMEINKIQTENELPNKEIIAVNSNYKNNNIENETNNKNHIDDNNTLNNKNLKEYLQSFDRRNSDTNYILGRQQNSEKLNLADEIRKLSDHLLMLAEINTKLGKDNEDDLKQQKQIKSRTSSTSDKLETIQESIATKSSSESSENKKSQVKSIKTTVTKSTSAIEPSDNKGSKSTTKSKKISTLSVRLQQSLDETPKLTTKSSKKDKTTTITSSSTTLNSIVTNISSNETTSKAQNLEDRASKLLNGFKQQLLSTSSSTNLISSVPWPITNKRTKFRINQMSRDVPIGSPDTHQPIDLEDAANTTKDCLLHLLEKYNENDRKNKNGPIGRHQSISVDWNITDNLEYQSMSSINAFFRRHPTKGSYVRQLQAQLEAKSKQT